MRTISGDDADYIPKIVGAGEIFYEEGIRPYQLMHNGIKIFENSYYGVKWPMDIIRALKGHHEPQEEKCFYEVLKWLPKQATMIELGAYWAYYSLWFASEIPGARNYLIEPDKKRLKVGMDNFKLNKKRGVFYRAFIGTLEDPQVDAIDTGSISIDDFIAQQKIDHVHILHSDIQGAEYQMLQSAIGSLEKIDYFFISTHSYEKDHLACLAFLKNHEFIILAEHSPAESCSGDGLIVAKNRNVPGLEYIKINKY